MWKKTFQIITGDITAIQADAIVNPTDSSFSGTGGIDFAIHKAAGWKLTEALHPEEKPEEGQAIITPAFGITSAKWIIHTVGPRWKSGHDQEDLKLAACYRDCLRLAIAQNCASIAFPCISTGTKGFPIDRAAEIAVRTVANVLQESSDPLPIRKILFVCAEKHADIYKKHLKEVILDVFLHDFSPPKPAGFPFYKYYFYMHQLANLEWGNLHRSLAYHENFLTPHTCRLTAKHPICERYEEYAQNLGYWDYNTCLAFIIEIHRPAHTHDGPTPILPHLELAKSGTLRKVLLRMQTLLEK